MNGLHQQLAAKRKHLAKARETAAGDDPREAHAAGVRAVEMERDLCDLSMAVHTGESLAEKAADILAKLADLPVKGRDHSLAVTCFETGLWRLRNHLGEP